MKSKILLTAIFKDDSEVDQVKRMLDSFMPYMSGLCVLITGTTGKTAQIKKLVESYKGNWYRATPQDHPQLYFKQEDGSYIFANFAEARNVCWDHAEKLQSKTNFDFWTWADADDVLSHGEELDSVAIQAQKEGHDGVFFTYWYAIMVDKDGQIKDVMIEHLRERLLKPGVFRWTSRLHEVCVPKDEKYQPKFSLYGFNPKEQHLAVWIHMSDMERMKLAMERNIKILELQKKEEQAAGKDDPRTTFYLAKTYYDMRDPKYYQLIELLIQDYLRLSGWNEERSSAWEYLGNIKALQNDHRGAIDCYHNAMKEFGNRHMPPLLLAKEYAEVGDAEQSNFWLETALRMDPPSSRTTITNPLEVKHTAASLKYNDAIRRNDIDQAIYWLKVRNEITGSKDDGMLKTLEEAKLLNQAAIWFYNYAKWLKDTGYEAKIPALLQALPYELGREPFAFMIANEYRQAKTWKDNEICYYASWGVEHFEKWSPKAVDEGMGGSETAVVQLAKHWAKMGYKVTVYCDPREDEGEHDGVTYRPWYEMNWKDKFNILILWRSPHLVDRDIDAKLLFMDLHDVASQLDWTDKRMERIDRVFFKSKFHRSMLPKLPESKVAIISNGI